ncbi:hypothetical protein LTR15_011356 [Elasticomyces elasticus]|nr:hypothetical protein LTR15_011356 [Elasticomyces elasticus]
MAEAEHDPRKPRFLDQNKYFFNMPNISFFQLTFTAPIAAVERCKDAIFAAGAGRYPGKGGYTEVCTQSLVNTQFRPGPGARPNIGSIGVLEQLGEVRVETLCIGEHTARAAVAALKEAHPYEEPVYFVMKMEDF